MKSSRIDNEQLRSATYLGNVKRMVELLNKGLDIKIEELIFVEKNRRVLKFLI